MTGTIQYNGMTYQEIGNIIKDKRKALGNISMEEAGKICGVSKTYFSRIEAGLYISPVKLDQIATGLNVSFCPCYPIKDKPKNWPSPKKENTK
jgi:transcriptional regulator with XRE-family HTH domain